MLITQSYNETIVDLDYNRKSFKLSYKIKR